MKRIYDIQQFESLEDIESYKTHQVIYYATNDLDSLVERITNNFTDLWESGEYPYIVLRTIDLDTIIATNEPLRIFQYQIDTGKYKEIGYLNVWVSSDKPEGIQYL
jgi:hypothetical protein